MTNRSARCLTLAAVGVLAACSDSAPRTQRSSLTVWALDEGTSAAAPQTPLENAEVFFDPPGGGARLTARTATDGHVVFEADFTKAGGTVTVVSSDHVIVSALDASPETARARPNDAGKPPEDLVLVLPRVDQSLRADTVELRGALAGKKSHSSVDVSVSALRRLGSDLTKEPSYAVRAPRGQPFFLIGHEIDSSIAGVNELTKSFRLEVPPRDADGALDIDIEATPPLPLRPVHLRAAIPSGGPFGADTSCSANVFAADSTLLVGVFRRASNDGSGCDVELTVADVDIAPDTPVTTGVLLAPDGSRSVRSELGVLADGASLDGFVLPPIVADASRSLRDPIPIERLPAGADVRIDVFAANQLLWRLSSAPGGLRTTTLTMPAAPLRFSADVTLLAITITAQTDPAVLPSGTVIHRRLATSRDIIVRR